MEVLCVVGLILIAVTVIGHGLWVFAASLLRSVASEEPALEIGKLCLECGAKFGVKQGRCVVCGSVPYVTSRKPLLDKPLVAPKTEASLRDELQTTIHHLKRLGKIGSIPQEQCDRLVSVIEAELAELAPRRAEGEFAKSPAASSAVSGQPMRMPHQPAGRSLVPASAEVIDAVAVESLPAVHPLDRPYIPTPPREPSQPRRPLADVLQSFMEESNIRWGEILAAMLIVLCSVGLVISLRATLKNIPYFPAILFTLFTVSFHGAGLYTLKRWKLQAVSRVILIISLLLVPLTFCGAIVLRQTRPATDPLFLIALLVGIVVFTWVCHSAWRELVAGGAWPLTVGVLGPSLAQVLIQRLDLTDEELWRVSAAATLPVLSFLVATGWQIGRARTWKQFSPQRVIQILRVLGIATFAILPPLALILAHSERRATTLARLSPLLSLAAAAGLALGLLIHRRTTAKRLVAWQTAGTAILVLAGVILLLLAAAAWPEPEMLLAVGVMNCVILAFLGTTAELPVLFAPSVACAALAVVMGLHLAGGHFAERTDISRKIVQAALMGRTSVALSLLGAAVAGISAWRLGSKKTDEALMLLASAGGVAALAVLVALFSGFVAVPEWPQDRDLAAVVFLVYGVGLIAWGPVSRRAETAGAGSLLLWIALVQALVFNGTIRGWLGAVQWLPERPVLTATLVHGVVTAIGALVCRLVLEVENRPAGVSPRESTATQRLLSEPQAVGAAISLIVATPFIVWVQGDRFSAGALMGLAAAVGWGALAIAQRWQWAISGLQLMLAISPALLIAGLWKARHGGPNWLVDEQHVFAQLIAAALATLPWSAARRLTSGRDAARRVLNAPWPAVDQVLLAVAVICLPLATILLVLPDIGWELSFEPYMRSPSLAAAGELPDALRYGWIALAVVLAALAVSLWERISVAATVGVGIATFATVSLAAGHFEHTAAAASASRWAAAVYALIWGTAYVARDPLRAAFKRLPWLRWSRFSRGALIWFCAQPLLLSGRAILILTIIAVYQDAHGVALRGPAADSVFGAMGPTVSYAAPLMALVAVLLGYAIRERQAGFVLGGAAVSQFAVNLAYLLHVHATQPADVRAIVWLQWNSVAAGAYALVWLGLWRWVTPRADGTRSLPATEQRIAEGLWLIPVAMATVTAAALVGWAAVTIIERPAAPAVVLALLGSWLSYLAVGFVLAAVLWRAAGRRELLAIQGMGDAAMWLAAGMVPLVAASVHQLDRGGQWLAFHTLQAGWVAVGVTACAVVCLRNRIGLVARLTPHHVSVAIVAGLVVALAIRGNRLDPMQPWWSLGGALAACGIAIALGLSRRSQPYAYASTGLMGLAVALLWTAPAAGPWLRWIFGRPPVGFFAGWEVFLGALVTGAGFWLSREIANQRRQWQSLDPRSRMPRVHALVALAAVPLYFVYRLAVAWFLRQSYAAYDAASLVTTLVLGGVLVGGLWDRRANWTLPLLFWWGGAAWCLAIGLARPWLSASEQKMVAIVTAVAAHVALTGQVWSYGANLAALGERLGVSDTVAGLVRTEKWLPVVNLVLAAAVCVIDLVLVLNLARLPLRVVAAWGPAVVAWGILCLAQQRRRDALQLASLLVAGLSAVFLGWAQIAPLVDAAGWLAGTFRLLMVLAALTFAYGLVLPRFLLKSGSWNAATRKAGYVAAAAAMATLVVTLVLEIALFEPGRGAPVENVQVAAIAVVLLALIAGLVSLAVLPGRDPLVLSDQGRQVYVYAAEITAALLFAHLYVCRPMWFDSILRPYWPFIVMGLAFWGVGSAELFERWRIRVLAEPLSRTGALLPLLPVIGWWAANSKVDYSLLLLVAGILYLSLSYTRKSWAAMVAAAVAGNGALWSLLTNSHLSFAANPQLWLIPPALSVLVAAQVNRRRLAPEMLAAIRYAATIVIYVSSTSEIFTRGFGGGLLPPMVLLGVAVAGALAGIALRVRAFLFLGSTFTLVALLAMIRHAAQAINNIWPWFAFGITLGVAILVLRGVLENKRAEVTALIARLRQWEQ